MKKDTTKKNIELFVPRWERRLSTVLRFFLLCSGIYQTFFGETSIGILTLISVFIISMPTFVTRGKIRIIPIEIEIFLFVMVFFQLVIGEARDWYTNVPYYDKFVHYLLPMFMSIIGFLLIYTLYYFGDLRASVTSIALVTILVTIGLGALWEIVEYTSDEVLYPRIPGWHHFQGSLTEDALHDTMNDLIVDSIGAVAGAGIAMFYVGKAQKKKSARLPELLRELSKK